MIVIGVLVAVSAAMVYRRDGMPGVTGNSDPRSGAVRRHPAARAGGLPARRVHRGNITARESVAIARAESGLKGLLIGTAFGAILPGGPFTAYPVASALLAVGADFGATIAMVVSWTLIGYGRAVAWELPIMGTDFTLWRIGISLPLPVLAGALGRFVYVRLYPRTRRHERRARHRHHPVGFGCRVGLTALQRGRTVLTTSLREGATDFINIVPRIALGVIGSGYIAAVIPRRSSPAGSVRTAAGSASPLP